MPWLTHVGSVVVQAQEGLDRLMGKSGPDGPQ